MQLNLLLKLSTIIKNQIIFFLLNSQKIKIKSIFIQQMVSLESIITYLIRIKNNLKKLVIF